MAIVFDSTAGTITGLSVGGLPDGIVDAGTLADDAITAAKIDNNAVGAAAIAENAVVQAAIADEAINEARMQISNSGTNGQVLSKQSGATGGLTWADSGGSKTAPSISNYVLALDMTTGGFFATSLNSNINSFTVTNIPVSGNLGIIVLELTADGTARTVTWTFNNIANTDKTVDWAGGTAPTMSSANDDRDTFVFFTYDGGDTWSGSVFGQAV